MKVINFLVPLTTVICSGRTMCMDCAQCAHRNIHQHYRNCSNGVCGGHVCRPASGFEWDINIVTERKLKDIGWEPVSGWNSYGAFSEVNVSGLMGSMFKWSGLVDALS